MTYEKDIPEYALQPARAPQIIRAEAIYHKESLTCPLDSKTSTYCFEEDILVPDTKADMVSILFMDASCDILPTEKQLHPKSDELLNLTGMISIQTLYLTEDEEQIPLAITSKVPYKYQWHLNPTETGEGVFSCRVKSLEYMIINERKFRVKVTLEFHSRMFCQKEFDFFTGLKEEELEMKTETVNLSCLELVKRDGISIDEEFRVRESERVPECILKQTFEIAENYRQVTTEKIVINGFIYVNLLYLAKGVDEKTASLCAHHQRIEFTQFIPIEKSYRGKKWCAVRPDFQGKNLAVTLELPEAEDESAHFRIKGEIETRVELYELRQEDLVIDAYQREKHFCCRFGRNAVLNTSESAISEVAVREIINLPDGSKAEEAVFSDAMVSTYQCTTEKGRLQIHGEVKVFCLWKEANGTYHTTKETTPFHSSIDMEKMKKDTIVKCKPLVKQCNIALINERQMEFNCTLLLCCESDRIEEIILLEEPGFILDASKKEYPMTVVVTKDGENLWNLAKRYRTTESKIRDLNHLNGDPMPGQKLLIMK